MKDYHRILADVIGYSRARNYVGWDKHDGMSSRVRTVLPIETKWLNLVFQESIKRAPVNVRPLLRVEQRPSPKGLSLFLLSTLNAYEITGQQQYLTEAETLAERVVSHSLEECNGFCLYHNHELQGLSRKTPIRTPNIVSTSYGVKALLRTGDFGLEDSYPQLARSAVDYIESELHLQQSEDELKVSYKPTDCVEQYTLNANALAARLYLDLYTHFETDRYREPAERLLSYVARCQEDVGGWKYTDPPSASHLSMDNYHNGFIIESFLRYQEIVDSNTFSDTIERALAFYRTELYESNGAPNWDETNSFPRDIHAAAQGIIVFTHAGEYEFAETILDWTRRNLYAGDGRFYYQKRRYYTKRFTLMRWCEAWMAYALSEFLRHS